MQKMMKLQQELASFDGEGPAQGLCWATWAGSIARRLQSIMLGMQELWSQGECMKKFGQVPLFLEWRRQTSKLVKGTSSAGSYVNPCP